MKKKEVVMIFKHDFLGDLSSYKPVYICKDVTQNLKQSELISKIQHM